MYPTEKGMKAYVGCLRYPKAGSVVTLVLENGFKECGQAAYLLDEEVDPETPSRVYLLEGQHTHSMLWREVVAVTFHKAVTELVEAEQRKDEP